MKLWYILFIIIDDVCLMADAAVRDVSWSNENNTVCYPSSLSKTHIRRIVFYATLCTPLTRRTLEEEKSCCDRAVESKRMNRHGRYGFHGCRRMTDSRIISEASESKGIGKQKATMAVLYCMYMHTMTR